MSAVEALQGEPDIRKGFEAFIDAARRLEQSYTELQVRAAAIDTQLAESNRKLESTLVEREMVFASLPVGLLSLGTDGSVRWCNPEAVRLREAVARAHEIAEIQLFDACEPGHAGRSLRLVPGARAVAY